MIKNNDFWKMHNMNTALLAIGMTINWNPFIVTPEQFLKLSSLHK